MDISRIEVASTDSDTQVLMDYENAVAQRSKYMNAGSKFRRQVKLLTERIDDLKAVLIARNIEF